MGVFFLVRPRQICVIMVIIGSIGEGWVRVVIENIVRMNGVAS